MDYLRLVVSDGESRGIQMKVRTFTSRYILLRSQIAFRRVGYHPLEAA